MKYDNIVFRIKGNRSTRQAVNNIALAGLQRITMRGHHYTQGRTAVPLQLDLVQASRSGSHHHFKQVGFQAHHDRLGFRVSHAAVEFQRFGLALRINHQACI